MTSITPRTEADWEQWKPIFTNLYMDQNLPLPRVMKIMEEEHSVKASTKMYKNKVKDWGLSKYMKAEQAQQIVNGALGSGDPDGDSSISGGQDDTLKRAKKSLKRKRARERAQTQASSLLPDLCEEPESYARDSMISPTSVQPQNPTFPGAWTRPESSKGAQSPPPLSEAAEKFLINLRMWTNDAFMSGQWDSKSRSKHQSGRKASRTWASDLTAGTSLFRKGREDLAWRQWRIAAANFNNPNLFKTWYHETPIRLLFEISRLAHDGHRGLASEMLSCTKLWAEKFLDDDDSRRALYSVFGQLDPSELRGLYDRAAKSLYSGFESRIGKKDPLLYEIRLNRALDLLWYDSNADLSEWVPSIDEVDESCGPNHPYSVYFLLLEAYRLVAQDSYEKAEDIERQVNKRLEAMKDENTVDPWRVGLAYRRLGRIQQFKKLYTDARISFNKALRYIRKRDKDSGSIQLEICQDLERLSKEMDDLEDAAVWSGMLEKLEKQVAEQEAVDRRRLEKLEKQVAEQKEVDRRRLENEPVGGPFAFRNSVGGSVFETMYTCDSFMLPLNYGFEDNAKRTKLDTESRSPSPGSPPDVISLSRTNSLSASLS